jgi:hypothetical protein
MSRLCRVLLVAVIALGVTAPSAVAVPDKKLGEYLGAMWKAVLETPTPQNPFTPGAGPLCIDLGGAVAPFAGLGTTVTCTVKPGTKVFIAPWSSECSTFELAPYHGDDEPTLRACARAVDASVTTTDVFLDGKLVPVTEVTSGLQRINLPTDNIFGIPAGTGVPPYRSVAHGWVTLLHPLNPGTHTITFHVSGQSPPGTSIDIDNTTTIIVKPGH